MASAADTIKAAEDRLKTARFGLSDMNDPTRALSGLFNAVVFGRMVTFTLQNMRNDVGGFNEWYDPIVTELKADPLMKFFWELRTGIEKKAEPVADQGIMIKKLNVAEVFNLPKPPGAIGFFIGDEIGGSGWDVRAADGAIKKYYVTPPDSWGVAAALNMNNIPVEFKNVPATDLVARYLDRMDEILASAKVKFSTPPP
jgi:hypothetical protein